MNVITIIPAYNEEKTIKNIVNCALKYSDVLLVDDGSTDGTSKLAKDAGAKVIKHYRNRGKGAAIKTGLKEALYNDYQVIVLLDGDGQHDPRCIPQLVSYIGNAGIVIGSRFKDGAPEGMPLLRKLSNTLTTHFIRYMTGYQITDSQCGFRVISSNVVRFF